MATTTQGLDVAQFIIPTARIAPSGTWPWARTLPTWDVTAARFIELLARVARRR